MTLRTERKFRESQIHFEAWVLWDSDPPQSSHFKQKNTILDGFHYFYTNTYIDHHALETVVLVEEFHGPSRAAIITSFGASRKPNDNQSNCTHRGFVPMK